MPSEQLNEFLGGGASGPAENTPSGDGGGSVVSSATTAHDPGVPQQATPVSQAQGQSQQSPDELPDNAPPWARKAVTEERRKRKEASDRAERAERELAEFRKSQTSQAQTQQKEGDDPAEFYADPIGYTKKQIAAIKQEITQEHQGKRLHDSVIAMRESHQDYQAAEDAFVRTARENPWLTQQMLASPNPAKFAYERGKELLELDGVTSLAEFRERERAKIRQEVEAELAKKNALASAEQASTSSAGARGTGSVSASSAAPEEISLKQILAGRRR